MRPILTQPSFSRILLLHLGRVSEVIFALPACQVLRERFPQAEIALVATPPACDLFALSGISVRAVPVSRLHWPDFLLPWVGFDLASTLWELRQRAYEIAVDFHPSPETVLWLLAAGVRSRLAAVRPEGFVGLLYTVWRVPDDPRRHLVDRYLEALRSFGITPTRRLPRVRTDPSTDARLEQWLRARGVGEGELLVGLCGEADPGEAAWPADRFRDLAHRLYGHFRARLLDVGLGRRRASRPDLPRGALSLRARSLGELASALARCALVISGDTAAGHLAAALGVPTLMLGCRRTRRPLGEEHRFIAREDLPTSSVEQVFDMASEMLGRSRTAALFRS